MAHCCTNWYICVAVSLTLSLFCCFSMQSAQLCSLEVQLFTACFGISAVESKDAKCVNYTPTNVRIIFILKKKITNHGVTSNKELLLYVITNHATHTVLILKKLNADV